MIRYWKVTAIDEHGEEVSWTMKNHLCHNAAKRLAVQECQSNGFEFKRVEQFQ